MLHACLLEEASGFRIFEPYTLCVVEDLENIRACVALCEHFWIKRPCMDNTILIATIQHQVEISPTTFFDPFFESHTTWQGKAGATRSPSEVRVAGRRTACPLNVPQESGR